MTNLTAARCAAAYAACERDARRHYENFPVASRLLPPRLRPHVAAVYAFARAADDFADEGERSVEERHGLLDGWLRRLEHAAVSDRPGPTPTPGEPLHSVEIFTALGATIRTCALPLALFTDLVSAFRQDITTNRYASWADLLDYCRRSANPVGRLVLRLDGCSNPALDEASDAVCTALQLTNFLQDVKIDADRGRIYLPMEELFTHRAREEDLMRGEISREWRAALASVAQRTRGMFDAGRRVCDAVHGRLRYELRVTWLGGIRILDHLETVDFDVVRARPRLGSADAPWFLWHMVRWSTSGPAGSPTRSRMR